MKLRLGLACALIFALAGACDSELGRGSSADGAASPDGSLPAIDGAIGNDSVVAGQDLGPIQDAHAGLDAGADGPPIAWSPSLNVGDRFTINGNEYEAESAFESWSINLATNTTSDLTRFEVRSGDYWQEGGTDSERAELDGWPFAWSYAEERWMAFSLLIEPGEPFHPDWCFVVQTHGGGGGGLPFQLIYEEDHLIVQSTTSSEATQHYDQPLSRDQWHAFVIRFKAGPSGDGVLQVWLDGAKITDFSGAIGEASGQHIYWKFGIYRGYADIPQTLAAQYANMEVSATDLSARIASPKPIPTTF